ncbi:MAG: membrane biogenesis protein [Firmicutes bacterium]|nr:membrane biogenesis protein [Clostridiales bacterium]MBQ2748023.1 membrane biogenesis protein [Bacillota bacterium]MBQ9972804.1 membrane biogenesis protein [Bacillota bacterium]
MANEFLSLFKEKKPIIAVLHGVKGTDEEVMAKTVRELDIFERCGIDGVLVENYFCTPEQAEMVLAYVEKNHGSMAFGINLLDDDPLNFELARKYNCDFMQVDSVCGHLTVEDDIPFEKFIKEEIARTKAKLIGGVRFKYQPYLSGRPLDVDLALGIERCHAMAVTGEGTGMATATEKVEEFRKIIGDFPLVVAAGVTLDNIDEQLAIGDAIIVGSYLKEGGDVKNPVSEENTMRFMDAVRRIRG